MKPTNAFVYCGRLAILQRVLPSYRAPFFDALAAACTGGLSVCAGEARPGESIAEASSLGMARRASTRNLHLLGGSLYLCYQLGLIGWLRHWDPDALIVEANPRYLSTPDAVGWMKRRGRPVIGWGLGSPASSGWRRSLRLSFLRPFDALLTYSRRGAEGYAALGFPSDRIFVAPNAAVPQPLHLPPERPAEFTGRPCMLFVGRLQARKRVDVLLRACATIGSRAATSSARPRLVIVGDGPERAALQALAAQVYPQAEFPGPKREAELEPYFKAADLFVLPGTGGLAVQESMSWGLPVIMGRGDGTNDDLVRPGNGWQVPDDDLSLLIATIEEALEDVGRLRAMGAESYRIVREEINLEKMVEAFVGALRAGRA